MKITNYLDFINESKLEILLEANIKYTDEFKRILTKIKSDISTNLIELQGKDIDVSTNYIDISDKNDIITFTPDDKMKQAETIVDEGESYPTLAEEAVNKGIMSSHENPKNGDIVISKRELTSDELTSINKQGDWVRWISRGNKMFIVKAKNSNGEEYECMVNDLALGSKQDGPKSELKIGRFVRRILDKAGIKVTDKQIEDFVNLYKSRIDIESNAFRNIEIINGEQIRTCYNSDSYDQPQSGQLWSSCMRYDKCSGYFDIYCKNPNQVSMVILKNEDTGKVKGRAILWTDEEDRKFMDRIYTIKDSDVSLFIEYAKQNKWIYKKTQENDADTRLILDGEELDINTIVVNLEEGGYYNRYPYMDTLKYLTSGGILTNSRDGYYDYILEDTDGGNGSCDNCGGNGTSECSDCGGSGTQNCYECHGSGNQNCGECEGSGHISSDDGETIDCTDCNASGIETCQDCGGDGNSTCTSCGGDGRYDCPDCN